MIKYAKEELSNANFWWIKENSADKNVLSVVKYTP